MTCPYVHHSGEGTHWCSLNGPGKANHLREFLEEALATMDQADHRSMTLKATQIRQRLTEEAG